MSFFLLLALRMQRLAVIFGNASTQSFPVINRMCFIMQYQLRPSGSLPFNIGFQSCPLCAEISLHFLHWVSCTWCNYAHTPFHKMVNLFPTFTSERPSLLLYSPFRYKSGTDLLPFNLISYRIFYQVCYFNFYLLFFCLLMPLSFKCAVGIKFKRIFFQPIIFSASPFHSKLCLSSFSVKYQLYGL